MKTLFKVLALLAALVFALVLVLSLVFYYSPGLQRRAVLGVLENQPGVSAKIDHIHIRLTQAEIRGLDIRSAEESISLESLEARYSLRGLMSDRVQIELVSVKGLKMDVAAKMGATLGGEAGESQVGSDPVTTVPSLKYEIGQVRLDGTALLPGNISSVFNLKMDNIKPDAAGAVSLEISLVPTGSGVSFEQAEFSMTAALHQTGAGIFDWLEGDLTARLLEAPGADWVEARLHQRFEGNADSFDLVVDEMQLQKGVSRLLDGAVNATGRRADGGGWMVEYSARMNSDLARVSGLSIVPIKDPLRSGQLELRLAGQFHEGNQVTAKGVVEVRDLRPAGYTGRPLSLKLEPEMEGQAGTERLVISTPIRLVGPSTTTAGSFATTLEPGGEERQRFDAQLVLDEFSMDEWQPIIDAFTGEEPTAPVQRDATPDVDSPWSGFEGNLLARINRLQAAGKLLADISARIRIEEGKTVHAELAANSGQSPLKAVATLDFQPDRPAQPYALTGMLDVQRLDVAPLLKVPGSNKPVLLEGVFNASGTFQSNAPNLAFLADKATGDFVLQSVNNGVFRPLGEKTSLASGVSGILGALAGNRKEVGWVQQVIDQLKEIPFTQMTFRMGREKNLDLFLRDLDLISRETRIKGSGAIQYKENAPLIQFPMDMNFELLAKGRLADALRAGNQLRSEQPDPMGFYPGPPLPLRGSLAQPESLLINLLMESGAQLLPGLLRK